MRKEAGLLTNVARLLHHMPGLLRHATRLLNHVNRVLRHADGLVAIVVVRGSLLPWETASSTPTSVCFAAAAVAALALGLHPGSTGCMRG